MGSSSKPVLVALEGRCNSNGPSPLRSKALEAQARRRWQVRKQKVTLIKKGHTIRTRRSRRIMMNKRARLEGPRRPTNVIHKRVRTLRKLIPNRESVGLDGLFRDTADYLLSLQMRVKVMQIMVNVLSGSDE